MGTAEHSEWSGKTGGRKWMQQSLVAMFRKCDIRIFYVILVFVVPFYMLFNRKGYNSIYRYFRERFGYGPVKAFRCVYRNHFVFGQIILDRFATYAGKRYEVEVVEGQEEFDTLSESEGSFMMLSSHIGNYELAGYTLHSEKKRICALVFGGETETVMENRNRIFAGSNITMVPVREDMSHLFEINRALSGGDIVSMPADRVFGSPKTVECDFLGKSAKFPSGPFAIAVQRGIPILSIFVMKRSAKRYEAYIRRIDVPAEGRAIEKRELMAREYVADMERIVRIYPAQWFNYYDFWA